MKAVQFTEYGPPSVLQVVEVVEPHPGPGEIRVAVRAAGVNAIDWKLRAGLMQELYPLTLPAGTGIDAAGIVDEVGPGVTGVKPGDAVFGSGSATYAELAILKHWAVKPDGLELEEAAGYPGPFATAVHILGQLGVSRGQTLVVSGAAGGVGSAVLQIARDRGIAVVGTASEGNLDYLESLGATGTTYGEGFADRVRAVAKGGVDAALDLAGSGVIAELIGLTGDPKKVLSIADFSAPQLGAQVAHLSGGQDEAYAEAARLFTAGGLHIPIQQRYTLQTAGDAQAASQTGHVRGRLIVTVG